MYKKYRATQGDTIKRCEKIVLNIEMKSLLVRQIVPIFVNPLLLKDSARGSLIRFLAPEIQLTMTAVRLRTKSFLHFYKI